MDGEADVQLTETLSARVKGEIDFVINVAGVRQVPWERALKLYPQLFAREAELVLARVAAARERRKGAR